MEISAGKAPPRSSHRDMAAKATNTTNGANNVFSGTQRRMAEMPNAPHATHAATRKPAFNAHIS